MAEEEGLPAVKVEDLEGVVDDLLYDVVGGIEDAAGVDYAAYMWGEGAGYVVGCQDDG